MFADYDYNPTDGISYPLNYQPPGEDGFLLRKRGAVNPIYPEALVSLCKSTECDLSRLRNQLIQQDPCYAFDMTHWHKANRKHESLFCDDIPADRLPKWQSANGIFADGQEMTLKGWRQHQPHEEREDYNDGPKEYRICYLCTTLDEHKQHLARRGPQLKPKVKRRPQIKYIPPPPVVKKKEEEIKEKQEVLYKITVKTGNKPQAGTSAKVSIKVKGRKGWMTKKVLRKKLAVNFCFGSGTTETFYIKGPDIGELHWLVIEHDGIEKKHSWYLEEVHIINMNTSEMFVFVCKQWLSLYRGDFSIKKELKAQACDPSEMEYEIRVFTAKKRMAGTDANVFITFYGKNGVSPKYQLQNRSKNMFEKGSEDVFKINTKYVGDLSSIRLEHDNSGAAPGWLLEKVVIQELDDPGKNYTFPCGQWFACDEGDGKICRTLHPMKGKQRTDEKRRDEDDDVNQIFYEIDIATGKKKYAGTDATIFIKMYGTVGVGRELEFKDENGRRFEKGSIDHFRVRGDDVGDIKKIQLRHDNKGVAAGWYCKQVVIKRFFSKEEVMERLTLMEEELDKNVSRRMSEISGDDVQVSTRQRQSVQFQDSRPAFADDDYKGRDGQHRNSSRRRVSITSDEDTDDDDDDNDIKNRHSKKKITYKGISHYVTDDDDSSDKSDDSYDDDYEHKTDNWRHRQKKRQQDKRTSNFERTSSSASSNDNSQVGTRYDKDRVPFYDEYLFVCEQWLAEDEDDGQITRLLRPKSVTTFYKVNRK